MGRTDLEKFSARFKSISCTLVVLLCCASSSAANNSDVKAELDRYAHELKAKGDAPSHETLGDVYRVRDDNWKAQEQYLIAKSIANSALLDLKIGQTYMALHNYGMAAAAFNGVIVQNPEDPLVQESLVDSCGELLKASPSEASYLVAYDDFVKAFKQSSSSQSVYRQWVSALAAQKLEPDEADYKSFEADLSRRLSRAWFPPSTDTKSAIEVIIVIAKSGLLCHTYLVKPGDSTMERSVKKAVVNADPFRPFPPLAKETKTFIASFEQKKGEAIVHAELRQNFLMELNNDALKAINSQNYQMAIEKLEKAIHLDPTYKNAQTNLGIAYTKYASLQDEPMEALKHLHRAVILDPNNSMTQQKLSDNFEKMGKNSKLYSDRVAIGDLCRKTADFVGAIVEYGEGLKIKDDYALHEKLGDVYRVRDENDKAIEQYLKAQSFGDTASLEVKLGQAYQARKDMTNAIAAYRKAETLKADDPLVEEALVAGWEEALRPDKKVDEALNQNSTAHNLVDFSELSSCIKESWTPPKRDDFKTAKLSARFFRDGRFTDLKVVSSSQDSSFDNSALKAIRAIRKSIKKEVAALSDIDHSSVNNSTVINSSVNNSIADGSILSIEFQHIIGGPKIVLVTLVK